MIELSAGLPERFHPLVLLLRRDLLRRAASASQLTVQRGDLLLLAPLPLDRGGQRVLECVQLGGQTAIMYTAPLVKSLLSANTLIDR